MANLIQSLTAQMLATRTYCTGCGSETLVNTESNLSSAQSSDNMSIHSEDVDLNVFLAHLPEKKKRSKRHSYDEPALDSVKHNLNPKPPPIRMQVITHLAQLMVEQNVCANDGANQTESPKSNCNTKQHTLHSNDTTSPRQPTKHTTRSSNQKAQQSVF